MQKIKLFFNKICPPKLHPLTILKNKLKNISNNTVMSGPFKGMRYVEESIGSALTPKLLGTYELELHSILEQICQDQIDHLIDIGAAEGYYAVGLAIRCPRLQVIAFESEKKGRNLLQDMAIKNKVSDRITIKGHCDIFSLKNILPSAGNCLIIMDIEGGENDLLLSDAIDFEKFPILVETHDFKVPGITKLISEKFNKTHTIKKVDTISRELNNLPINFFLWNSILLKLTNEQRPCGMSWLYMKPR